MSSKSENWKVDNPGLAADPQNSTAAVGGHSSGSASDSGDQGRTAARTPIPTIGGPRGFGLRICPALLYGGLEQIGCFFCHVLTLNPVPFLDRQLDVLINDRLLYLIVSHVPDRA
jgi:hypothetical protein